MFIPRSNPHFKKKFIIVQHALALFFLTGCTGLEKSEKEKLKERNATGEFVYRQHDEISYPLTPPRPQDQESYPWEEK
jgi:hypothetical protein